MRATVKLIFQRIENSQECRQIVCYFVRDIDILFATFVMKTNHLTWLTPAVRAVSFLERRIIFFQHIAGRESKIFHLKDESQMCILFMTTEWNEKKLCLLRDGNTMDIIDNILSIDKTYSRCKVQNMTGFMTKKTIRRKNLVKHTFYITCNALFISNTQ